MADLAFAHLNLRAPRALLDALHAFYRDVVGLQAGPRPAFRSFGYWLYADGRDVLHLSEAGPGEERGPAARATYDHVAFACRGLARVEQRLRAQGIEVRRAEVPGTGQVQLFLRDPAGNGVELNFAREDA
jgi:catechol-2,3-dioxygenase